MENRTRSEGWHHAKISGHKNESEIENLLINNPEYQNMFLSKIGKPHAQIVSVSGGGPSEKNVPCIFAGETTKAKADIYVNLDDGETRRVSVKKSLGGQVYLITIDRFLEGFELQYKKKIPKSIKDAICLFWGSREDTLDIIKSYGTYPDYERRKHRVVAETLKKYNQTLYSSLLNWFKSNIYNITDFCFSRGLAKYHDDWADLIWYKNELGENSINEIFTIGELCLACDINSNSETNYGPTRGGTTIQLPFGFVQWHSPQKTIPGCMQFHHDYDKISSISMIIHHH